MNHNAWWNNLDFMSWLHVPMGNLAVRIVLSILFILALLFIRALILRALSLNKNMSAQTKLYWSVSLRNIIILVALVGIIISWSRTLATIAFSLLAVAAALVIATKELIACLLGSFFRVMGNTYKLGDLIEFGPPYNEAEPYRGIVVDITMLSTTIVEINHGSFANQRSGRILSLPNRLLLEYPIARSHMIGKYISHTITIPLSNAINAEFACTVLEKTAEAVCEPFASDVQHHVSRVGKRRLVNVLSANPDVSIFPVDDRCYRAVLRLIVPLNQLYEIERKILRDFMAAVYGNNRTKGKATNAHAKLSKAKAGLKLEAKFILRYFAISS